MRFLFIWLTLITVLFVATAAWYCLTPVFYGCMDAINTVVSAAGWTGTPKTTWDIVQSFLRNGWTWAIVILVGGLVVWAIVASIKREPVYTMEDYP